MTPDELFTRVQRQRADLAAVELAMDALMQALPPEQQDAWLQALRSLQTTRRDKLVAEGMDPLAIKQGEAAIDRRRVRLMAAQDRSTD